jgi:hypothetical protein
MANGFWDLLSANGWPVQPFVTLPDPMQPPRAPADAGGWAAPAPAFDWTGAPAVAAGATPYAGGADWRTAPDADNADRAQRAYEFSRWAFGPPSPYPAQPMRAVAALPAAASAPPPADARVLPDRVDPWNAPLGNADAAPAQVAGVAHGTASAGPASPAIDGRDLPSSGRVGILGSMYDAATQSQPPLDYANGVDPWLSSPREFQQVVHPLYPNPPYGPPHEDIPGGPWTWRPDAQDRRGGKYHGRDRYSGDWDEKDGHWDIDDGYGHRQRYNRHGAPISEEDAHGPYRGPRRLPFPPRMPFPFIIIPPLCATMPELCGDPNEA